MDNDDKSVPVRIPLFVLDAPPRRLHMFSAAELAEWRRLRRRLFEAEIGTPFDPRAWLYLRGAALERWCVRRRAWLAELFRDEVTVEK
jgi:hypothetical protein